MANYPEHPQNEHVVFLEFEDVIAMATGEPFESEREVSDIRLTKEAAEKLDDLAGAGIQLKRAAEMVK